MLVIGLIVAVLVYGVLGYLWITAGTHLNNTSIGALATINKILFVPDNLILTILRGLILVTIFYLVADFLVSGARRGFKRRAGKESVDEVKKRWVRERLPDEPIPRE